MKRVLLYLLPVFCGATLAAQEDAARAQAKFFETEVRPILANRCFECHGEKKQKGGLRVDDIAFLKAGGDNGPALVPGKPEESPLIEAVRYGKVDFQMPPKKQLPAAEVAVLEKWVQLGAPWPAQTGKTTVLTEGGFTEEQRTFWCFQPLADPMPPEVPGDWARTPIDRFVAKKHGELGLTPAPAAAAAEFVRRATLDLHGLPPTAEQLEAFAADTRPNARERFVDALLESPHYGERWAQHWLDLVRYAESDGYNADEFRPNVWPYRDWVINSLNADKPYNQFVREQLAGDEIAPQNPEVLIATSFLRNPVYEWNQVDVRGQWDLILTDITDTTGELFLGLSFGCARCHNHKFDPISQVDYYAMKAVFAGVQHGERPLTQIKPDQHREQLTRVKAELDEIERALWTFEPLARLQPGDSMRPAVQRRTNIDRFAPTRAKFVRFTIDETNGGSQPCLDEVEFFTTEAKPRNVALATHGTKVTSSSDLPGHEIHQLKHVNDGRYGNSASWISNEPGRGWVLFELPEAVEIDRVLWSRDRPADGKFGDRVATKYRLEIGMTAESLHVVATADDRQTFGSAVAPQPARATSNEQDQAEANRLLARQVSLNETLRQLTTLPQVYAGRFVAPEPTHRFHRGDPLQPKEPVAPASLASFGPAWQMPLDAPDASRRQQLAQWITDPQHPLTARVLVNRFWHSHFGQGLVTTPSDFGRNGAMPSHPELLDWLAMELASPKSLHRLIVTSATYRQNSAARADAMQADAGTRLLWRYPPRRLEAEPLRDAILSVCGNLDDRMGGPGFDLFEPNTNYVKVYNSKREFGPADWRRMVYQAKPRMQLDDVFGQFDCPDAGQITPKRTSSITALQALNLLNSRFIVQQSSLFASRLEREAGPDVIAQVRRAYSLAFLRLPTDDEQIAATQFVNDHGLTALCRALLNANEFLFVF